jgi:hypothetical protein
MMEESSSNCTSSVLAWVNGLADWRFTGFLYLLRWAIILPLSLALRPLISPEATFQGGGDPWGYLIPFLIVAPTLETLIECTLPYWVLHRVFRWKRRTPWPFVVVSALAMVVLHPLLPVVIVMAFVTGSFLAYVYAHFAQQSHAKAFLHTAVFHAAINLVGWTILMIPWMS